MTPFVKIFKTITDKVDVEMQAEINKAIYYEHGHPLEIVNVLAEKTQSNQWKYKKYPLIALFQDFKEDHKTDYSYMIPDLTVIIATDTNPIFRAAERYNNTFEPILYPIYESLIKFISASNLVNWNAKDHIKIDRLYWGKSGLYGNQGNIFNDYLDAIEINFKNIEIFNKC